VDEDEDDFNVEEEEALWADPAPEMLTYKGKGKGKAHIDKPTVVARRPEQTGKGKAQARTSEEDQGTKRKRDNTIEPVQASGQTAKKLKVHQAREQVAKQSAAADIKPKAQSKDERRKSRIEEKMAEFSKTAIPKLSGAAPEQTPEEKAKLKAEDLKAHNAMMESKMSYLGMHPDNPDASSMIVNLPEEGEDRVLTAITNPFTKKHVLHDTAIPHNRTQRQTQQPVRTEKPFIKDGKHGRRGDFENDPDRRTGRGHEVTPEDRTRHNEYIDFRALVYKKYPLYPGVAQGEIVDNSIKQTWDDNEIWYNSFNYKYGGNLFNHLWPCGCEKLRGESEDGESEEESW